MILRRKSQRGLTLIELMIVVAIMGILSSVAVPSYMRWVRRVRTTEATMNLRKIFDASVIYFALMYAEDDGNRALARFPPSTPLTPSVIPPGRPVTTAGEFNTPV